MSWLTLARYGVPAAIALFAAWATIDRFAQAAKVAGFERCEKAAGTPLDALPDCPEKITARVDAARRAAVCEGAILHGDLYVIRASCGERVKRQHAELTAATANLATARADLKTEREGRADAIARAEVRATTLADRTARNDQTIKHAPRGDDGRVHCDAACVRRIAGD